jgi:ferredoxin-NADP reductase
MNLARILAPRRLRLTAHQWRQDLAFLYRHATTAAPPVRLIRTPSPQAVRGIRLTVTAIREETAEARTIFLDSADPAHPLPAAEAGQFITFDLPIAGERLRRSYSLCTAPGAPGPRAITVKRVAGGRASAWLTQTLAVGDVLEALGPPTGRFVYRPEPGRAHRVVLIGAGSGITPLMAILRTALAAHPDSRVALLYGNRAADDVIFRDALSALAPDRLTVRHVLERPDARLPSARGRLTAALIARELPRLLAALGAPDDASPAPADAYYVCGPPAVMDNARAALLAAGVPEHRIHEERFEPLPPAEEATEPATVLVRRGATETPVLLGVGESLLDATRRAGVEVPSSCTMGGCGACRVRVVSGRLAMPASTCLSAAERHDGYALACVARCAGPATVEVPA